MSEERGEYKAGEQVKLLPCPFCGSEKVGVEEVSCDDGAHSYIAVVCNHCRCEGPAAGDQGNVVKKWNTRYKEPIEFHFPAPDIMTMDEARKLLLEIDESEEPID